MIQEATLEDLESLTNIATEFAENSIYKLLYSKEKIVRVLKNLIEDPNSLVIFDKEDTSSTLLSRNNNDIIEPLKGDKEDIDTIDYVGTTDIIDLTLNPQGLVSHDVSLHCIRGFLLGITNELLIGDFKTSTELSLYVSSIYRGLGISKSLIKYFEEWSKTNSCKVISLCSFDKDIGSLYESLGYTPTEYTYSKLLLTDSKVIL